MISFFGMFAPTILLTLFKPFDKTFKICASSDCCFVRPGNRLILPSLKFSIILKRIKFSGKGCSISQASASMLTEFVKNKKINEINEVTREDMIEMLGIPMGTVKSRINRARKKIKRSLPANFAN